MQGFLFFVSVIIVNWNGIRYLEKCLKSVLSTDFPHFEVILVDNASTDDSVAFVKERFGHDQRLKIVQNKRNVGFAEGSNIGLKHAKGKYIVFLNNDTEVNSQWLEELVKVLQSDGSVGAAQSKLLLMNERNRFDCAGGFIDYYGYSWERGRNEEDEGQYDRVADVFYAKGAAMIVKRELLDMVGTFDPKFFMYFEETDLCWRIWLRGYRVVFVPSSKVYHVAGGTAKQTFFSKYFLIRNHIRMIIKNYARKNLVKMVTRVLIIEFRKSIGFMLKNDSSQVRILVKALVWNLSNLRETWQRRQRCQQIIRRVPDEFVMKRVMLQPLFPFPHGLIFPISRYLKKKD